MHPHGIRGTGGLEHVGMPRAAHAVADVCARGVNGAGDHRQRPRRLERRCPGPHRQRDACAADDRSFPYSPPGTWMPGQPGFPLAGQSYVDPVFGTTIRRLTNNFPSQSYSDIYGTNGWWNADGTRWYHRRPSGWVILDTTTGAVVRSGVPSGPLGFIQFDPVNPDVYYYTNGANLRQYSI